MLCVSSAFSIEISQQEGLKEGGDSGDCVGCGDLDPNVRCEMILLQTSR
jgi:hypothetical protein